MKKEHVKTIRKITLFLVLVIFSVIIYMLFPVFKGLSSEEGRTYAKEILSSYGIFGSLVIILLEILKVFVVMLPGEPIEILAGMCFGPIGGLIVIYIGIVLSTFVISKMVKKFGIDIVKDVVSEEKFNKVNDIIKTYPKRVENIIFILYFLPIVPKDFLTYIGSLLPMSTRKFIFISLIARFPAVFSSTFVGTKILDADIKLIVLTYVITYSISLIVMGIYKLQCSRLEKQKENNKKIEEK